MEYYAARSTMTIGGALLIILCVVFTAVQMGLLKVLVDCFTSVQSAHIERLADDMLRQKLEEEKGRKMHRRDDDSQC